MGMKDPRWIIGGGFIALYYCTLWLLGFIEVSPISREILRDGMLQLGPPVGIIIGALFRTDRTDEVKAENSGAAFRAMEAQAKASQGPSGDPVSVEVEK
jgi:hypothetical protein